MRPVLDEFFEQLARAHDPNATAAWDGPDGTARRQPPRLVMQPAIPRQPAREGRRTPNQEPERVARHLKGLVAIAALTAAALLTAVIVLGIATRTSNAPAAGSMIQRGEAAPVSAKRRPPDSAARRSRAAKTQGKPPSPRRLQHRRAQRRGRRVSIESRRAKPQPPSAAGAPAGAPVPAQPPVEVARVGPRAPAAPTRRLPPAPVSSAASCEFPPC